MANMFSKAWDILKYGRMGILRCNENCEESQQGYPQFRASGAEIEVDENGEPTEALTSIEGLKYYCSHCYGAASFQ
mgnify:FL=1|tara:strand:- start:200 stop:427 length:228 start_codon:yes stop_codon:yes gene_type:complete